MDYKKILEGVVNIINTTEKSDIGFANICAYIDEKCPELKESEDEKIRKRIIHALHGDVLDMEETTKAIAWLEKQGSEPNWCHNKVDLSNCSEEYRKAYYDGWNNCNMQYSQCKSESNDVLKCLINGMKFYYEDNAEATWGTEKFSMKVKDILSWLEKQGNIDMGISDTTKQKLKDNLDNALEKETPESWNEFLEKQGEQKPVDPDTLIQQRVDALADIVAEQKPADKAEPKFNIGDIIFNKKTKEQFIITNRSLALQYYHDEDHLHEVRFSEQDEWELVEQKSADKVGPKFREGEWITNGDYTWKVVEVKPLDYILQSQDGNIVDDTISHVDEQFHSFTPEDAKDGDVLVVNDNTQYQWIGIFKEHTGCTFTSYCHYNTGMDEFITNKARCRNHGTGKYSNIHPATKEQRDLLFQKIHEAGYEWDVEKKELKKAEQKTAWSEEDENRINRLIAYFEDKESFTAEDDIVYANWLKSLKDRVKPQPKQEWSKEDEREFDYIIRCVENGGYIHKRHGDWLKSLRPQN